MCSGCGEGFLEQESSGESPGRRNVPSGEHSQWEDLMAPALAQGPPLGLCRGEQAVQTDGCTSAHLCCALFPSACGLCF